MLAVLAGCTPVDSRSQIHLTQILAEEESLGPVSLIGTPGYRLLPNETLTQGDNVMIYKDVSRVSLRPHVARTLDAIGGPPAPFDFVTVRDFQSATDAGGEFKFVVARPSDKVTCVLAIREVTFVGLELAVGLTGTTKVLRNCVTGTIREALSPFVSNEGSSNSFL